jgi:hypothetical protein
MSGIRPGSNDSWVLALLKKPGSAGHLDTGLVPDSLDQQPHVGRPVEGVHKSYQAPRGERTRRFEKKPSAV